MYIHVGATVVTCTCMHELSIPSSSPRVGGVTCLCTPSLCTHVEKEEVAQTTSHAHGSKHHHPLPLYGRRVFKLVIIIIASMQRHVILPTDTYRSSKKLKVDDAKHSSSPGSSNARARLLVSSSAAGTTRLLCHWCCAYVSMWAWL